RGAGDGVALDEFAQRLGALHARGACAYDRDGAASAAKDGCGEGEGVSGLFVLRLRGATLRTNGRVLILRLRCATLRTNGGVFILRLRCATLRTNGGLFVL